MSEPEPDWDWADKAVADLLNKRGIYLTKMTRQDVAALLRTVREEKDKRIAELERESESRRSMSLKFADQAARLEAERDALQVEVGQLSEWAQLARLRDEVERLREALAGEELLSEQALMRAERAEAKLAEAVGLLKNAEDRLSIGRQSEAIERLVWEIRTFLAAQKEANNERAE